MKLNQRSIPSQTANSVSHHSLLSTTLPMSQDVSTPPPNRSRQVVKFNRELSWQVASNLFVSFKYAWAGISYAFQTQRNFRIHVAIGTSAIGLGAFLQVTPVEIAVITLTTGAVLAMELLNTALESVVDLSVEQTYHELAKIAKDCAAAAVLVSSLAAILVAGVILLPPLYVLMHSATR